MASAKRYTPENEDVLVCPICMDTFDTPKMLECQHSYCLECIFKTYEENYKSGEEHQVVCPICRNVQKLLQSTSGGTNQLTIDDLNLQLHNSYLVLSLLNMKQNLRSHVNEMTTKFKSHFGATSSDIHLCLCGSKLTWSCSTCKVSLCNDCLAEHCEAHPLHEVSNSEEQARNNQVFVSSSAQTEIIHENCICDQKTNWHCKTCNTTLCNECFPDHLDVFDMHEIKEVLDAATSATKPSTTPTTYATAATCSAASTTRFATAATQNNSNVSNKIMNYLLDGKLEIEASFNSVHCNTTCDMAVIRKSDGTLIADTNSIRGECFNTNAQELKTFCSSLPKFQTSSLSGSKSVKFENVPYVITKSVTNDDEIYIGIRKGFSGLVIKNVGTQNLLLIVFKGPKVDEVFLMRFIN